MTKCLAGPQLFVDWRHVDAGEVDWVTPAGVVDQWGDPPSDVRGVPTGPSGIRLEAQQAETIGPIIACDRAWESQYNMYFSTVLHEGGRYRGWYTCIPPDHKTSSWSRAAGQVMCYAESDDGFTWRKPELGLLDYCGERTNIVFGRELSPYGCQSGSIFVDPHGPAPERYKLVYVGVIRSDDLVALASGYRSRFGDAGVSATAFKKGIGAGGTANVICGAVSPDGIRWVPIEEPLMVWPSDTLNNAYWDEAIGKYVAYLRLRRDERRMIVRAESADFRTWRDLPRPVLEAPLDWPPTDDVYTNSHTIYPGTSDGHLMFPGVFHRFSDSRDVYLASSSDGVNWKWVPGGPIVRRGSPGSWNGGDINPGIGLVPLGGDRIALPIMGYARPHKFPRGGSAVLGQPGWAIWRKDRISAVVAESRGEFSTMTFMHQRKRLSLNVETALSGAVAVEVRDAKGQPLPGRCFADADPVVGDTVGAVVTWKGESDISSSAGVPISLAFRLGSAKLFAFEFVD